jgi:hypothetical protein
VRNRVSFVGRELPNLLKASGITLVVLLAFALRGRWAYERMTLAPSDSMATLREDVVPRDADVLRARAAAAADTGAWEACLADLDAAREIDGADRGAAERLRGEALDHLANFDAPEETVPDKK